ncbi:MAG: Transcriptional regulator, MerR family [Cypionkella sp.]|uniref:MerR family transcriptional regulator n=1 Tax=Cypionkella sp. TaxID=2811411 RepID=UPI00261EE871|nr:MerR family DNA-binding transcriptional regulator [Cypionkella sp.]MDB5658288.1 Transcriptional regulator, MerR family [Cypionkella sp.]MDB5666857.1 Transcriptional regulator, MerR family [Cypionkella sp.]
MTTVETLTIREMCDTYQVTARTLRFYETKELLSPIRAGSRRLYTKQDRARLQLILRGKRFGFSLEDIRQLLDMYNRNGSNQAQLARTFDLGQNRLEQMKAQRDELSVAIAELETELQGAAAALSAFRDAAE